MVILKCKENDYRVRMIENNRIEGILPVSVLERDGDICLKYDNSGYIALGDALNTSTLGLNEIRTLVGSLGSTADILKGYLMDEEELLLAPENIYVKLPSFRAFLCVLPGNGGREKGDLTNLFSLLLRAVDTADHDAVVYAYALYQQSQTPGIKLNTLSGTGIPVHEEPVREPEEEKTEGECIYDILADEKAKKELTGSAPESSQKKKKRERYGKIFSWNNG